MKNSYLIALLGLLVSFSSFAQWKPAGDKIKTPWAEQIDPNKVLPEYPRPIMERADWLNLNGLWEYSVLPVGQTEPSAYQGKILVPFAIESSLSGVQKNITSKEELWYHRSFQVPNSWKGKEILLHFGAVDWKAEVFINDIKVGAHTGGYTAFSFNITPFLTSGTQKLVVKVWDGTDEGFQPRGKQVSNPKGIWYTPVSGIWQTVWLEPVPVKHIQQLVCTPNIDSGSLQVEVQSAHTEAADWVEVRLADEQKTVSIAKAAVGQEINLPVADMKLWSPESPFLYQVEVNLYSKGKKIDRVLSYAAMRKISTQRDSRGILRMQLNNQDYFQFGPLDQGWWPDGLYTAPTDEALVFDIQKTKDFGYNLIRKHVKVEPARWYTHCDRLGVLVWQDMPNGDANTPWQSKKYFSGNEYVRSAASEANYRKEWKEIIDQFRAYPCIVVWVPFNEAWGQFKTEEITNWTKAYDSQRLVNSACGGNFFNTGDILSLHNYPQPKMYLFDAQRVNALGEYGGIGLAVENHLWKPDKNWGYIQFKNAKEVTDEYSKYADTLLSLIKTGFSAAIYTQTTDVEIEVNGLMTYDRKVIKMEEKRLRAINRAVCESLNQP